MGCLAAGSSATAQDLPAVAVESLAARLEAALAGGSLPPEPLPKGVRFADDFGGLHVGSPVTVKGIRVGTVREVAVVIDSASATMDVPLVIDVVPDRIHVDAEVPATPEAVHALSGRLVCNGLRVLLQAETPLGGQHHVTPAFVADAPPATLDRDGRYPGISAAPSLAQALRATVDGFLARFAVLPLETAVGEATATLAKLRALLAAPEIRRALDALGAAGGEVRDFISGPELAEILTILLAAALEQRVDPSTAALQRAAAILEAAARETGAFIGALDRTIGPRSPLWGELLQTSRELAGTSRALRLLIEHLERHPDALLRGRPEPKS